MTKTLVSLICLGLAASVLAIQDPSAGADSAAQSAADVFRDFSGADAAFLPAGMIQPMTDKNDLSTILLYPSDQLVVVDLTGSQIKQALELSASLYPVPNSSFLQVSGLQIKFNAQAMPNSRIQTVTVGGQKCEPTHHYQVAMPASLQRGGLGYGDIWNNAKVVRKYNVTLEQILKGKVASTSLQPRWSSQG